MKRIMIIGPGNSGKSTLATKLGKALNLPVIHLDRYFWLPNWVKRPQEEWQKLHKELVDQDKWIIEGDYPDTMPERIARAEAIIFLNIPKHVIIPRSLHRVIKHQGKSRPEVAEGNVERFGIKYARFIKVMAIYNPDATLKLLDTVPKRTKVVIVRSKKEANDLLSPQSHLWR